MQHHRDKKRVKPLDMASHYASLDTDPEYLEKKFISNHIG
jgi:hypothetical protein